METRSCILQQLRTADSWLTGDQLSADLGISRAAISKHVGILRKSGYEILTAPNRGYRLQASPDFLFADEVQPLATSTCIGQAGYHHHLTLGSTNKEARQLAEAGAPEGTLVVSEEQTEGKGRKGRDWISPSQTGVYATLILRPTLPIEDTPLLTLLTAVATAEAIKDVTGTSPTIKWPNDILLNGRKIAGILTEVSSDVDRVEFALIGLGLNINTPEKALPKRLLYPATSLATEVGSPQSRQRILASWLSHFEVEYAGLSTGNRQPLLDHWKALATITGRKASIQRVHDCVSGIIKDIDADGALLLKTSDNKILRILSGDVSFDGAE